MTKVTQMTSNNPRLTPIVMATCVFLGIGGKLTCTRYNYVTRYWWVAAFYFSFQRYQNDGLCNLTLLFHLFGRMIKTGYVSNNAIFWQLSPQISRDDICQTRMSLEYCIHIIVHYQHHRHKTRYMFSLYIS